ncbi:Integrase zinc binding domain [Popillia japonica]|uniref:Integrase zinc binding domain n=1 Tax=Popillia japonica TaxID=7064 RepID=A0AAW1KFG6_POPJA
MSYDVIRRAHEDNGHFAVKKTESFILREYWIPKLRSKIESYIRNCIPCILAERKRGKQECFLNPIFKEDLPLRTYHIDHLGPLVPTKKGYKYLLVVVDGFTKFIDNVQLYLNKTYQRAINTTPAELLFGVDLRLPADLRLKEIIESEYINTYKDEREKMRLAAKQDILKIQEENRKSFNSKRKEAHKYRIGDVVAIKRTQFATQGKFKSKFLGPYKITAVRAHDRYDVEKLGNVEGNIIKK